MNKKNIMDIFTQSSIAFKQNMFLFRFFGFLMVFIGLSVSEGWGQTSFLGLDGGFEGSATIDNTSNSSAQTNKWTKSDDTQSIISSSSNFRSGSKSLSVFTISTSSYGKRIWTPLYNIIAPNAQLTIQFYCKSDNSSNFQEIKPFISDGGTTNEKSQGSYTPTTADWQKNTFNTYTNSPYFYFTSISGGIFLRNNNSGGNTYIDDVCIYTGGADNAAPDAATSQIISSPTTSSLNISWTQPSTGVDGGGYLVIRGTTDPTTTPNINGIYAVGNSIGTGTVVYQGTGTNFTDNGLSSSSKYYYRIYTYDKAYNYSKALSGNGTTATSASDYFRSKATGNWGDASTWESSSDNTNWISATLVPTSAAASVTILNGHLVTVTANATASILTINSGAKLTLSSGKVLTVTTFNINSDATGTGTFVDLNPGGFTATNTNIQLNLTSARNWYMSSPTSNFLVPSDYTYLKYDEPGNNPHTIIAPETAYWEKVIPGSSVYFSKGIGYIAQATGVSTINFTGTLNTQDLENIPITRTETGTYSGFNLMGNPYPSYLDISTWGTHDNTSVEATYWYRSKNGNYVFDTHNLPSGITTGNSGFSATNLIPPMQAFWVRKKTVGSGTITFSNANRSHQDDTNNKFRISAINRNQQILRMQISNGTNTDETVLYFNENASNGYDVYDSPKMSNNNNAIPEIYTNAGTEQLAINGMNIIPTSEIPLGFQTGENRDFTIKASEIKNFDANTHIILKDKLLNTEKDLTDGSAYTFNSDAVNSTSRFSLIFKTSSTANGFVNNYTNNSSILVYKNEQNKITINYNNQLQGQKIVNVYNMTGEKLASLTLTSKTTVLNKTLVPGVYLVKVTGSGKTTTSKIIIN